MDTLLLLIFVVAGIAPLAILCGWLAGRGWSELGPLIRQGDDAAWRRAVMPWPRGVQEEDGVSWGIGFENSTEQDATDSGDLGSGGQTRDERTSTIDEVPAGMSSVVRPSRINPRVRIRSHAQARIHG